MSPIDLLLKHLIEDNYQTPYFSTFLRTAKIQEILKMLYIFGFVRLVGFWSHQLGISESTNFALGMGQQSNCEKEDTADYSELNQNQLKSIIINQNQPKLTKISREQPGSTKINQDQLRSKSQRIKKKYFIHRVTESRRQVN